MNKQSFADLGVSPVVARTLSERGLERPFPVQASVIPDVLAGHDVLVKSPTGSGKTLALGVPLVDRIEATDPRAAALVLAPTRELASQIVEELRPLAQARNLNVSAAKTAQRPAADSPCICGTRHAATAAPSDARHHRAASADEGCRRWSRA